MAAELRQISVFPDASGTITRLCAEWAVEIDDGNGNSVDTTPFEDIDDDLPIIDAAEKLRELIAARGAPRVTSSEKRAAAAAAAAAEAVAAAAAEVVVIR